MLHHKHKAARLNTQIALLADKHHELSILVVSIDTAYKIGQLIIDHRHLLTIKPVTSLIIRALMSRLWTGFFGTESCRTPKIFQNPDFSLKRRDF